MGRLAVTRIMKTIISLLVVAFAFWAWAHNLPGMDNTVENSDNTNTQHEVATLGAGCFWCVEAVFEAMPGVVEVIPGYTGGEVANPTYEQVCSGTTGHAEVAQVTFDPTRTRFSQILDMFFKSHDPTTLNRQGADVGTQYRSAIFYHDEKQKAVAEAAIEKWNASGAYPDPIVTEVTELGTFYPAEDYHQDFYARNPNQGYCTFVIRPKLKKLGLE